MHKSVLRKHVTFINCRNIHVDLSRLENNYWKIAQKPGLVAVPTPPPPPLTEISKFCKTSFYKSKLIVLMKENIFYHFQKVWSDLGWNLNFWKMCCKPTGAPLWVMIEKNCIYFKKTYVNPLIVDYLFFRSWKTARSQLILSLYMTFHEVQMVADK
jgi:hypothetical protein